jgi:hypothetical protein
MKQALIRVPFLFLRSTKIILDRHQNFKYNICMKNKDINQMDLHEAISYLEKQHNCVIYGVLEMQGLEQDLSYHDLGVRSLSKVSRQEWKDAMEYAVDSNDTMLGEEHEHMVGLIADYLIENHIANPLNTLGGYSSGK